MVRGLEGGREVGGGRTRESEGWRRRRRRTTRRFPLLLQKERKKEERRGRKELEKKSYLCVPELDRVVRPLHPLHDGLGGIQQDLDVTTGAWGRKRSSHVPSGHGSGGRLGGCVRDAVAVAAGVERVERADRALESHDGNHIHRLAQEHVVDVDRRGLAGRGARGQRPDLEDVLDLVAAARDNVKGRPHRGHRKGVGHPFTDGLPVAVGVTRENAGPAQELVEERVGEAELVEVLGAEDVAGEHRIGDDDPLKEFISQVFIMKRGE